VVFAAGSHQKYVKIGQNIKYVFKTASKIIIYLQEHASAPKPLVLKNPSWVIWATMGSWMMQP
jgi:hypothetical protein